MNSDEPTGGSNPRPNQATLQIPFAFEAVSGDRWVPGIETAGSRATGETKRRPIFARTKPIPPLRTVSDRAMRRRRLCLKACLDEMERVRSSQDPILRSNSLADVRRHLHALWEMLEGGVESENLEEMVNVLQIAFCDEGRDALSPSQLEAIWSVLSRLYDDPDLDIQTANDLTQELIRGGIDVFREIG